VYPVMLEGATISALVVGGGSVATRKVRALHDAGAAVHVVAPVIASQLTTLAGGRIRLTYATFEPSHLEGITLVFAATNSAAVNEQVARAARARGLPVNVADAPEAGTFVTSAVHRAGDVVIAVTAGGVPAAAARIRDAVAERIDERYGEVVGALASLRRTLIGGGNRARWQEASASLVGADFCEEVERGVLAARVREWR
jgi:precorrin-2 dehydrogenase/sirohydrochlorin ferrochelatase